MCEYNRLGRDLFGGREGEGRKAVLDLSQNGLTSKYKLLYDIQRKITQIAGRDAGENKCG